MTGTQRHEPQEERRRVHRKNTTKTELLGSEGALLSFTCASLTETTHSTNTARPRTNWKRPISSAAPGFRALRALSALKKQFNEQNNSDTRAWPYL